MKTWRERIAEARERGEFSPEDWTAWSRYFTCPAGEVARFSGMPFREDRLPKCEAMAAGRSWMTLWSMGGDMSDLMAKRDFDGADRLLDAIEDRALELKRSNHDR